MSIKFDNYLICVHCVCHVLSLIIPLALLLVILVLNVSYHILVCRTSVMSSKKITSFFKRASVTDSRLPVPETPAETLANKLV
jgi:hypothetical protein